MIVRPMQQILFSLASLCLAVFSADGFTEQPRILYRHQEQIATTRLYESSSSPSASSSKPPSRRKILLSRDGPHFQLDKRSGAIEFGATVKLTTTLVEEKDGPSYDLIAEWLSDERALALSIWDEDLMKEIEPSIYQLQTMKLKFVTIELVPTVDMKMQTRFSNNDKTKPVFLLQSIAFDPNIQLLPGLSVSAEDLGIVIEVSGELRPTKDGTGVSGRIAFQTSGMLPLPLRILPDRALQAATDSINNIIVNFAIQSFEKGSTSKYKEFRESRPQTKQ